jgi:EpsI family protein
VVDQKMTVDIPGLSQPIEVNHYIVQNSDSKSVVVYWYQSHRRVVASEYSAKFWVVADALRYNRTDTALIRVVLPAKDDADAATEAAVDFVRAFFDPVRQHLWQ